MGSSVNRRHTGRAGSGGEETSVQSQLLRAAFLSGHHRVAALGGSPSAEGGSFCSPLCVFKRFLPWGARSGLHEHIRKPLRSQEAALRHVPRDTWRTHSKHSGCEKSCICGSYTLTPNVTCRTKHTALLGFGVGQEGWDI